MIEMPSVMISGYEGEVGQKGRWNVGEVVYQRTGSISVGCHGCRWGMACRTRFIDPLVFLTLFLPHFSTDISALDSGVPGRLAGEEEERVPSGTVPYI